MCSGSHKGKAEKRFHKQTSGLPFFPAWMELSLLPSNSGGFLRTNIHTGVSEATCCPAFVYCMIWNRTNPNTEAKQHMFLLPKMSFLPSRLLTMALGNNPVRQSAPEPMKLSEFNMFSQGRLRAARKHLAFSQRSRTLSSPDVLNLIPQPTETKTLIDSKVVN